MLLTTPNPWETTPLSALVSIGTHSLHLSTSGPTRAPNSPATIFFSGGGVPCSPHTLLQSLLSAFTRVYFPDRAGYDRSEPGPIAHPTAADTAGELQQLLKVVQVGPPYILVGYSYGCMIAREFLELYGVGEGGVVGMLLVDGATELMYECYPHGIPPRELAVVAAGVDFSELTHLREESRLTDEEWEEAVGAIERSEHGANMEDNRRSGRMLAEKRQFERTVMGKWPLSVVRLNSVRDYQLMYEEGVRMGYGNNKDREGARHFVRKWGLFDDQLSGAQVRLGEGVRYVHVEDLGHDGLLRRPEIVVEEVRWILDELKRKNG